MLPRCSVWRETLPHKRCCRSRVIFLSFISMMFLSSKGLRSSSCFAGASLVFCGMHWDSMVLWWGVLMVFEPMRSFSMSLTEGKKKLWKSRHSSRWFVSTGICFRSSVPGLVVDFPLLWHWIRTGLKIRSMAARWYAQESLSHVPGQYSEMFNVFRQPGGGLIYKPPFPNLFTVTSVYESAYPFYTTYTTPR